MSYPVADVVICGAGYAGVATAYHLAVKHGLKNVLLVDERDPLTLTSSQGTECYRNWWPGPGEAMVSLTNRSIDLMEELAHASANIFALNRRGYLYATADPARIADFERATAESASLGAGPVRIHGRGASGPAYIPAAASGFDGQPEGVDIMLDPALIREHFPYLAEQIVAVLHARRCGWLRGAKYGRYLLAHAQARGVQFRQASVEAVEVSSGRVQAVHLSEHGASLRVVTPNLVNAAGPFVQRITQMVGVELPVRHEWHMKAAFEDIHRVIPHDAPLLIWADPQRLPSPGTEGEAGRPLRDFPPGFHIRPDGDPHSRQAVMLASTQVDVPEPAYPLALDPRYGAFTLRGLTAMLPGLAGYLDHLPQAALYGGYYTKTPENRPLIGPLPVDGAYVIGALSGFGLMASAAAGELLAAHLTGSSLPPYAPAFALSRYQEPAYQQLLDDWGESRQL